MTLMVLLAALAACTHSAEAPEPVEGPTPEPVEGREGPTPALQAIDSLMWQHPDSALQCLLACRDVSQNVSENANDTLGDVSGNVSTTTFDDHYANLLLAELLYKNDYAQTNRAELLRAVGYFDSLLLVADGADTRGVSLQPRRRRDARRATAQHRAFLDARVHYINGVGYYERDSVVEACKEYLKALEVMEGCFEEEELVGKKAKFMALVYIHLSLLYSNHYLIEQALCFDKLSLKYYMKHDSEAWHIAWVLNRTGSHYDMMEMFDSAAYYYGEAVNYLQDTNNLTYRDIATLQAFLSYKKEHLTEKSLAKLHRLVGMAQSDNEILARYIIIGDIHYYEKQFDSARRYLKEVYDNTTDADFKMLSAERLQEIALLQGDTLVANGYALTISQLTNLKDEDGKLHSNLSSLCQQYEQNLQETQNRLKLQKATRYWGVVLGIVLCIVVTVTFFLILNRKRNKQLQTEKDDANYRLESERQTHKMQQAALSGRLKQSNEALRDVSKQLEQSMANNALLDVSGDPDDYSAYINTPICQYLIKLVHEQQFKSKMDCMIYKDSALSKEQLLALHDAAEKKLPRFTSHVRQQFSGLTDGDMDYCYLLLLGLNEADISALLQRAYSTVCERSRKINRIIEAKGDLYHTLRNMLSD
jgi:hypothetical protein